MPFFLLAKEYEFCNVKKSLRPVDNFLKNILTHLLFISFNNDDTSRFVEQMLKSNQG